MLKKKKKDRHSFNEEHARNFQGSYYRALNCTVGQLRVEIASVILPENAVRVLIEHVGLFARPLCSLEKCLTVPVTLNQR